jgi:predicted acetyltransferase
MRNGSKPVVLHRRNSTGRQKIGQLLQIYKTNHKVVKIRKNTFCLVRKEKYGAFECKIIASVHK